MEDEADGSDNRLIIDGNLEFGVIDCRVEEADGRFRFHARGEERDLESFGGERFQPWILIEDLGEIGSFEVSAAGVIAWQARWDASSPIPDQTYITMRGEGFSILQGELQVTEENGVQRLRMSGLSDLPFDATDRLIPFVLDAEVSLVRR